MASSPPPPEFTHHSWGPYVSVGLIILANSLCYFCNDNGVFGRLLWARRGKSSFFASNTRGTSWRRARPQEFWAFDVLDPNSVVSSHFVGDWALLGTHFLTLCWTMIALAVEETTQGGLHSEWVTWFTHWSLVLLSLAGGLGLATQARHMWRKARRSSSAGEGEGGGSGSGGGGSGGAGRRSSGGGSQRGYRVAPNDGPAGGVGAVVVTTPGTPTSSDTAGAAAAKAKAKAKAAALVDADTEAGRARGAGAGTGGGGGVEGGEMEHAGGCVAKWDALSIAYLLAMETAVIAAFFLDVYYWVVLIGLQGDKISGPATYIKHGGNLGVAFLEVLLTRLPIVSVHMQAVLAYGTAYMLFLWIYGNVGAVWRYGLNWYKLFAVIMHGAVPVCLCIFMLIWWGTALLRERVGHSVRRRREASASGAPSLGHGPAQPVPHSVAAKPLVG